LHETQATGGEEGSDPSADDPRSALLGVDVGGGGIRAGLYSQKGALLDLVTRHDGVDGAQFDADVIWRAVASAIRELIRPGVAVRAVGVTTHLATVLTRADGRPAANAMLWRDSTAWREAVELDTELGPMLAQITGRPPSAESAAARIRMLDRSDPGLVSRVRWLLTLKDYIVLRLTGHACTDPASASYSQLFDVRRRSWSGQLARACGISTDILPGVRPAVATAGLLTAAAAELTDLAPDTPVAVGGPDGSIGTLGSGASRPGVTVDIAGTTDVLLHVTGQPPDYLGGGVILNAHVLDGQWSIGGPTGLTGGGLVWLSTILGYRSMADAYNDLEPGMHAADPGDLTFQTVLTGRRFPGWNTELRGRIDGISAEHGPSHLLRAAEEGSVFEVRLGLDAIRATGAKIDSIVVGGLRATTPRVMQLRADILGVPVGGAVDAHASMRGAALAAGVAAGIFTDVRQATAAMVPGVRWYHPDPAAMARAEQRYLRWRAIMAQS
jgi:xylulokinase